jgi:phosphoribosyl 1,2-cyclic phosphodiesterase/ActR/RegA family two-component response regulator
MKTVLVVEPNQVIRSQLTPWLKRGWRVVDASDTSHALRLAREHQPQLVLCEWPTPSSNGSRFCDDLRQQMESGSRPLVIVVIGSGQFAEKITALEAGADEYFATPVNLGLLDQFLAGFLSPGLGDAASAINAAPHGGEGTRLKFWGVRGSIATPGPETVYYGGNTSCVEVRVNNDIIVLDAGTGLRKLGLSLIAEFKERPIHLNILITHTHWDHIQGFPFFLPAYDPKNKITIYGFEGASQGLQSTLSSQMESPYFPISMRQMPGHIVIRELKEMNVDVGGVSIAGHFVNHPGMCAGYRVGTPDGSIAYLPDVELFPRLRSRWKNGNGTGGAPRRERRTVPEEDRRLVEFIRDSDILILDAQYDAIEYEQRTGWGHSCVEESVAFALQAGVKRLFLFHHDPDHTDEQISRMVAGARRMAAERHSDLVIEAAREGCEIVLRSGRASQ